MFVYETKESGGGAMVVAKISQSRSMLEYWNVSELPGTSGFIRRHRKRACTYIWRGSEFAHGYRDDTPVFGVSWAFSREMSGLRRKCPFSLPVSRVLLLILRCSTWLKL